MRKQLTQSTQTNATLIRICFGYMRLTTTSACRGQTELQRIDYIFALQCWRRWEMKLRRIDLGEEVKKGSEKADSRDNL